MARPMPKKKWLPRAEWLAQRKAMRKRDRYGDVYVPSAAEGRFIAEERHRAEEIGGRVDRLREFFVHGNAPGQRLRQQAHRIANRVGFRKYGNKK